VIVVVPEAEPIVGRWRLQHTLDAPLGIPAHVTLLFPFVEPERVAQVEDRLAGLVAATPAFEVVFARTAKLPEVLYLEPEPAEPFFALTHAIEREWPDQPPYGGHYETVVPHLTVAESDDPALLDQIALELEPRLPLRSRVREASLFVESHEGRWSEHGRLPFGQSGVA
jgi:2'-5' RNA ligase